MLNLAKKCSCTLLWCLLGMSDKTKLISSYLFTDITIKYSHNYKNLFSWRMLHPLKKTVICSPNPLHHWQCDSSNGLYQSQINLRCLRLSALSQGNLLGSFHNDYGVYIASSCPSKIPRRRLA